MSSRTIYLLAMIILLGISCESEGNVDPRMRLEIRLTDAPGDYQQVNIDLQQVRVKLDEDSGWVDLKTNEGIYDLLTLQNGIDTLIVSDEISGEKVKEVRLVLGSENTVMKDSVLHSLKTPSAQQSGLKIKLNKTLGIDSTNVIMLDFDADASVVELGNGGFNLKPVIKTLP